MKRAFVFALAIAIVPAVSFADAGSDSGAGVRVDAGLVTGTTANGVAAYKGIPYARPPQGALRWMPPVAPLPWKATLPAIDYGFSCPQPGAPGRVPSDSRAEQTSEDCLTLNVWTPIARTSPLPVMVWLHGGGNVTGTGSQTYYDGSAFARDGIVLVTINYRLGAFGFFTHPALADGLSASEQSGNFGLMDQIAALRWVKKNIGAFGGDPANVTLFGESAGGEDAVILASSDAAKGLFVRAIAESAADLWSDFPSLTKAREQGEKIATDLGLPGNGRATAAQLRSLSADALTHLNYDLQIGPMIDGSIVTRRLADGISLRVPLIIGTNSGEGSLVDGAHDAAAIFYALPKPDLTAVLASYRARSLPEASDAQQIFTDGAFAAPARLVAARAVAAGQPAYVYRFDYVLSALAFTRHDAHHGSEIPLVFENFPRTTISDADRSVAATIHGCWLAFARTGTPVCAGAPGWKPYDVRDGKVMVFDSAASVRDTDDADALAALERGLAHH